MDTKFASLLFLACILLAAVIGVALFLYALRVHLKLKKVKYWKCAEGIITKSLIAGHTQNDGEESYRHDISYIYTSNGREIEGSQIAFGLGIFTFARKIADQYSAKYPVGRKVIVFYNPETLESVLESDNLDSRNLLLQGGALCFGIALFFSYIVY